MQVDLLEDTARTIFGTDDLKSVERWVRYWRESRERNRRLLDSFSQGTLIDFRNKKILDIGCGTGGMAEVLANLDCEYVGADYHHHVLQFASLTHKARFLQCSGTQLPFRSEQFDYIVSFDVIEHLVGGLEWQTQFMKELQRVLKPLGMILLTTPNYWFPFDAHTGLYGPQFLPLGWADSYIGWRNPGFIKEHQSFAGIRLLTPRNLRKCMRRSGLVFLHDLPCALDREDYRRHFPVRGLLAYLGLGWYTHAEFWGILVRREARQSLRLKIRKNWFYERNQPSPDGPADFSPVLDFETGYHNPQLGPGWYWHEQDRRGFRWTARRAVCHLESPSDCRFLEIRGYSPRKNSLRFSVDGILVGEHGVEAEQDFRLRYLLPFRRTAHRILSAEIRCSVTFRPGEPGDNRELGVMIFSIGLSE